MNKLQKGVLYPIDKKRVIIKRLIAMKLIIFFTAIFCLNTQANIFSQVIPVKAEMKNTSIKDVLAAIESVSNIRFFYNDGFTGLDKKVSVSLNNNTLEQILKPMLGSVQLTYHQMDEKFVVITPVTMSGDFENRSIIQQNRKIQGIVLDVNGDPIVGANVLEKGTFNGTSTDVNGAFALTVSKKEAVLVVSFIGYISKDIIADKDRITVTLEEGLKELDEVIVTALGISKSERALNYSATQISASEFSEVRSGNPISSLSGKVAGLDITGNRRTGSGKIVLRGVGEIASGSTNKPLYVIDGIPVDNSNNTNVNPFGGTDYGDGLANINMDDIEKIVVLKGPSAAALYGSKASRGAILVTTKKGVADQGIGVEFNTNTSYLVPYAGINQYQQAYGTGQGGKYPKSQSEAMAYSMDVWGAKLDPGITSVFLDGSDQAYVARYQPMDYYTNGVNTSNTISITGGNTKGAFRISYGNEYYKDITPAFNYMRQNLSIRLNGDLTSRLSYDIKLNFNYTNAHQRPESGHGIFNPATVLPILGADVDLKKMEAMGRDISTGGLINNWDGALNPYYVLYQYKNNDQKYKGIGSASISYKFFDGLRITARQGLDMSDFNVDKLIPKGSNFWLSWAGRSDSMQDGGMSKSNTKFIQTDLDVFAEFSKQIKDFTIDAMTGGNFWSQKTRYMSIEAADFVADDLYVPSNAKNQSSRYELYNKKMYGFYGSLDLGYKRFAYFTFTARNDWSSTLPQQNNSYFYPSVGGSFIFSEIMKLPDWFSFGKIRASWAEVGSDTDMYKLDMYYSLYPGGYPTDYDKVVIPGNITTNQLPPLDLKPMITKSTEIGFDVRFFNNRLALDVAYYDNTTNNQIMQVPIPNSSGFSTRLMNAGSVSNSGLEITLSGKPIVAQDFLWSVNFTLAHNKSKVNKLHKDLKSIQMYFCESMSVMAVEGEPYGIMYGSDYLYDENGKMLIDDQGYPLYNTNYDSYIGTAIPKVIIGLSNQLDYRNFYLNFVIDGRLGHKYYSKTSRWLYEAGSHVNTVAVRDEYYSQGKGLDPLKLGKIQSVVAAQNVYDAGFLRMKEIALGYRVPKEIVKKMKLQAASVSLVVSNPFFIWRGSDLCDPTFSLNSTVGMEGIENGGEPAIRSFGINLNLKF